MKRKIVLFLFAICVLISTVLCGCSQNECREEAKEYGESAVFYAEQYIDGIITADEAYQNIKAVSENFNEFCEKTHDDTLDSTIKLCESTLKLTISTLCCNFLIEDMSGGSISDIKDSVESIKKYIQ